MPHRDPQTKRFVSANAVADEPDSAPDTESVAQLEPAIPLSVVEALIAKIGAIAAGGGGITAGQLDEILQKSNAGVAAALKTALIPENAIHPHISAFSYPEGDIARPKPRLVDAKGQPREVFFVGQRQDESTLKPMEIEAFNAITQDCKARGGDWWAKIQRNGSTERLTVYVPCKDVDQRLDLPSLTMILHELASGGQKVDTDALLAQLNELKALIEAQQKGQ